MTLEKAIENIKHGVGHHELGPVHISVEAAELGIEALKRLKEARFDQRTPYTRPLPGETEE